MKNDELIFVLEDEEQFSSREISKDFQPKIKHISSFITEHWKICAISGLLILLIGSLLIYNYYKRFNPAYYFIDDGRLVRVCSNRKTEVVLDDIDDIGHINEFILSPDGKEAYIIIINKNGKEFLYYVNRKSKAEKILEFEVGHQIESVFYKGNNAFLVERNFSFGSKPYNIYRLKGYKTEKIINDIMSYSFREDGKGFSYTYLDLCVYSRGHVKNITNNEFVIHYVNSPYSNDVYFSLSNNLNSTHDGGKFCRYSDDKGVEVILDKISYNFQFACNGSRIYFTDVDHNLYYYDSDGINKIAENCLSYSVLSDNGDLVYRDDNTIFYRNPDGHISKVYDLPKLKNEYSKILVDTDRLKLYHLINNSMYVVDLTSGDYPEIRCITNKYDEIYYKDCSKDNETSSYYRGGRFDIYPSQIYGYLSDGFFIPFTKDKPDGDESMKVYFSDHSWGLKEGFVFSGRSNSSDDSKENLYFMKPGESPLLIEENIEYIHNELKMKDSGFVAYVKKSENNPDEQVLYATNSKKKVVLLKSYADN